MAVSDLSIVTDIAERVGNQSVVVVLDVKKKSSGHHYEIWTHNGTKTLKNRLSGLLKLKMRDGEIVLGVLLTRMV